MSILYPEQEERVWGVVTNLGEEGLPFLVVECYEDIEDLPNGLCYITTSDGQEIAALREYNKPPIEGCVWIRLIDEDIRGMADEELEAWIYGADYSSQSFALIPVE